VSTYALHYQLPAVERLRPWARVPRCQLVYLGDASHCDFPTRVAALYTIIYFCVKARRPSSPAIGNDAVGQLADRAARIGHTIVAVQGGNFNTALGRGSVILRKTARIGQNAIDKLLAL